MHMDDDELKALGCTPIEELITEDFGIPGMEERNAFEANCEAFIIANSESRTLNPNTDKISSNPPQVHSSRIQRLRGVAKGINKQQIEEDERLAYLISK